MNKQPWYHAAVNIRLSGNGNAPFEPKEFERRLEAEMRRGRLRLVRGSIDMSGVHGSTTGTSRVPEARSQSARIEELLWTSTEPVAEAAFGAALREAARGIGFDPETVKFTYTEPEAGDPADLM